MIYFHDPIGRQTDLLNIIWTSFFLIAFCVGSAKLVFLGDSGIFVQMMNSAFDMSKTAFEISLGLVGVMSLWMGVMRVGERGGFLSALTRFLNPLFGKLFPDVPSGHPALGSMTMNIAANMLGLDNAATPLGLKAMKELQTLNHSEDTASNAQILFLVINASSVTIFPVTIFTYRAQQGAVNPADVFIPILIATYVSTLVGLVATAWVQRINLLNRIVLLYLGGVSVFIAGIIAYFAPMDQLAMQSQSAAISNFFLFAIIVFFIFGALLKKVHVYDAFIDGAKDGFQVAISIIPFLVAMLVGIGVFRASGALDILLDGIRWTVGVLGMDSRFVEGLPTALMKPLSGSGARGLMIETMKTFGADSFAGRLVSVIQGSTETTFYIVALYFGSVGIRHTRHAVPCGLLADFAGVVAAIFVTYLFFG